MEEKTRRWLAIAIVAIVIACTTGCTIAYVKHPREWVCFMAEKDCEN